MTRDEAIDLLVLRLGDWTEGKDKGYILGELKQSQIALEQGAGMEDELPWFLLNDIFDAANNLQNEATALDQIIIPSDFLEEDKKGTLWMYDSTEENPWIKLTKSDTVQDILEARREYSVVSGVNTTPTHYAIHKGVILLGPEYPSVQETFRWSYYKKDTVLDTNIENNWLKYAPDLLIAHAGVTLAGGYLQNADKKTWFEGMVAHYIDLLKNSNKRREMNNAPLFMKYVPRR